MATNATLAKVLRLEKHIAKIMIKTYYSEFDANYNENLRAFYALFFEMLSIFNSVGWLSSFIR